MADSNKRLLSSLAALQLVTLGLLSMLIFFPPQADRSRPLAGVESGIEPGSPPATRTSARHEAIALAEFKAAIRPVLREELQAFADTLDARTEPRQTVVPAVLSADETHAQEEAAAVSAAVIQQALSTGVWTAEDTHALLPNLARLSDDQRLELVERFYTAVNRQQLELEDVPPL